MRAGLIVKTNHLCVGDDLRELRSRFSLSPFRDSLHLYIIGYLLKLKVPHNVELSEIVSLRAEMAYGWMADN